MKAFKAKWKKMFLPDNQTLTDYGIVALYLVRGGTEEKRLSTCGRLQDETLSPIPFEYKDAIALLLLKNFKFKHLGLDHDRIRILAETRPSDSDPFITVIDLDK
ncbi:uncharacterized protein ACHE_10959A [Aspergillus chevalieri]|uniref:Uncharacterized protein n=1 Tax=Aspergillus chevalieri TaxID=182096 RepID=A0A7R7VFW2_ASPCH|nr:uncharacterized protein ACHE_10959A [Aspergillus chevalieri]BCR83557.1 hypothetical protein ACHE_10959A [Aspergillus chevalieri]